MNTVPTTGTVIGFDFGLKRIGVAVGDLDSCHVETLTVLHAKDGQPDWDKVAELVADWQPTTFVVGNPGNDNAPQPQSPATTQLLKKLHRFHEALQARFKLQVKLIDEAYTSTEARQLLNERRRTGRAKKIRKGEVDMTAAAIILQSWMSQMQSENLPKHS